MNGANSGRWVGTWTAMPQLTQPDNLPPAPFTRHGRSLADTTLRQTLHASIGGERLRLRLSNAFGAEPLTIGAVSVAGPADGAAGTPAIRPGTSRPVLFDGRPRVTIPPGALAVSDPVDVAVAPRSNVTVSFHLPAGQPADTVTSHPGSRTTSHLAAGDRVDDVMLAGAVPVEHWYVLSGAEVLAGDDAAAVVVLGDSLSDGRGSTTDGNDRWPDQFLARLHAADGGCRVAVLNQGAGGNRVLNDGVGPGALARFDRDVLAQSGVRWLVVLEGVNDLGTAAATPAAQGETAEQLVAAYRQFVVRAHDHRITVFGGTLTPFGGHLDYDDPDGAREAARQAVNAEIRSGRCFDAVIDFDRAVRDPADARRLLPLADGGDHLHLGPAGYRLLAEAVPLAWFR